MIKVENLTKKTIIEGNELTKKNPIFVLFSSGDRREYILFVK